MSKTQGKPRARRGEVVNYSHPDWEPLLRLARVYVGEFMWMCEIELRGRIRIQAYKHCWSRRYLYLGEADRAFVYRGENLYREIDEVGLLEQFDLAVGRLEPPPGIPGYTDWDDEADGLGA